MEKNNYVPSSQQKNAAAFPLSFLKPGVLGQHEVVVIPGMTLRDYFAARSVSALVTTGIDFDDAAKLSYQYADAMLKAREL